jgi:hypothetical protein
LAAATEANATAAAASTTEANARTTRKEKGVKQEVNSLCQTCTISSCLRRGIKHDLFIFLCPIIRKNSSSNVSNNSSSSNISNNNSSSNNNRMQITATEAIEATVAAAARFLKCLVAV